MMALGLAGPLSDVKAADNSSMPQLTLPPAAPAPEEVAATPVFSFSATAATNYIFRGVSQTEDHPAVFGGGRVTDGDFYAGAGIENVDFHNSTEAEYDLSGGWTPLVGGFKLDLGMLRYGYIDEPAHTHIDTVDFKAMASHDFGPATFAVGVYYTPNFFGAGRDGIYFEGRGAYRITDGLTASGAVGRQTVDGGLDHTTWNIGLGYAITKNIGVDFRYYDTNEHSLGRLYGSHYVAAIKGTF
jgi:uncharacterized protein (TIGR02001 family)